ncbi:MAG: hypothetical protein D6805_09475 [Planctomycetota bacterium]|nr:MAG: hypothetical protein D6805_09475 [Planctomycetota bacterium]
MRESSLGILFWLALKEQWRNWRSGVVVVLLGLPILVSFIANFLSAPRAGEQLSQLEWYLSLVENMILQYYIWLLPLLYGACALQDEVEQGTLHYLLVRPFPRYYLVISKFMATVFFSLVSLFFCLVVCAFFYSAFSLEFFFYLVKCTVLGVLFYSSCFHFIGVLVNKPLALGVIYGFFWEVVMFELQAPAKYFTGLYHLNSLVHSLSSEVPMESLPSESSSTWGLLAASAILLGLASVIAQFREFSRTPSGS